jgi:hypothetical protein
LRAIPPLRGTFAVAVAVNQDGKGPGALGRRVCLSESTPLRRLYATGGRSRRITFSNGVFKQLEITQQYQMIMGDRVRPVSGIAESPAFVGVTATFTVGVN